VSISDNRDHSVKSTDWTKFVHSQLQMKKCVLEPKINNWVLHLTLSETDIYFISWSLLSETDTFYLPPPASKIIGCKCLESKQKTHSMHLISLSSRKKYMLNAKILGRKQTVKESKLESWFSVFVDLLSVNVFLSLQKKNPSVW